MVSVLRASSRVSARQLFGMACRAFHDLDVIQFAYRQILTESDVISDRAIFMCSKNAKVAEAKAREKAEGIEARLEEFAIAVHLTGCIFICEGAFWRKLQFAYFTVGEYFSE